MKTSRFEFVQSSLSGLYTVDRRAMEDARGFLSRMFCADEFAEAGLAMNVVQVNHTLTRQPGALRGMHLQRPPHAEIKLVSCVKGEVFDVAVDLRAGSPTYLQWFGAVLSASNRRSLFIPKGFAHGFQALVPDCELVYLHSTAYRQDAEDAVNPLDPRLAIAWPLPVTEMSDRDRAHPMIGPDHHGIDL